jgi:hypothetical protein
MSLLRCVSPIWAILKVLPIIVYLGKSLPSASRVKALEAVGRGKKRPGETLIQHLSLA